MEQVKSEINHWATKYEKEKNARLSNEIKYLQEIEIKNIEIKSLEDTNQKLDMEIELINVKLDGKENQGGTQYYDVIKKNW